MEVHVSAAVVEEAWGARVRRRPGGRGRWSAVPWSSCLRRSSGGDFGWAIEVLLRRVEFSWSAELAMRRWMSVLLGKLVVEELRDRARGVPRH